MSDVEGIDDLDEVRITATTGYRQTREDEDYMRQCCASLEALLRNRQELVNLIEVIQELNQVGMFDADKIDELYAKAKELDND